jgi:hypothetical protein
MSGADTGPPTPADIDPAFHRFLELFNQSRYWDSHEALEDPWRKGGSDFYHALILLASAFVHVQRGNRHGIGAQLGKAQPLLESRRPHYLGIDVDAILQHIADCRHIVAENREAPEDAWEVLIPQIRLAYDPARVRGDEPELGRAGKEPGPGEKAAAGKEPRPGEESGSGREPRPGEESGSRREPGPEEESGSGRDPEAA